MGQFNNTTRPAGSGDSDVKVVKIITDPQEALLYIIKCLEKVPARDKDGHDNRKRILNAARVFLGIPQSEE